MLSSITPLGERGRNMRWSHTVVWYVLGSLMGGVAIGALSASLGLVFRVSDVSGTVRLLAAAVFFTTGWAFDLGVFNRPLPSIQRQVNENWLPRYRGWVYGFGFGVQLGFGLVTITRTSTIYSAIFASLLSGSVLVGVAIGGWFGLLRAAPILLAHGLTTNEQLARFHLRLQSLDGAARRGVIPAPLIAIIALVGAAIIP